MCDKLDITLSNIKKITTLLGIKNIGVTFEKFPKERELVSAFYNNQEKMLVFNKAWFEEATIEEILVTCYHEVRHCYQFEQIKLLKKNPKLISENISRIKQWESEVTNYHYSEGNEQNDLKYLSQDIELDSIAFAYYEMQKSYQITVYIPKLIKEEVLKRIAEYSNL